MRQHPGRLMLKNIRSFIAAAGVAATTMFAPASVLADAFVPCSFNRQVIACRLLWLGKNRIRIIWRDGKAMTYHGVRMNGRYLRDSLGGNWRYLDFDMGKSFSLSNPANGNVIIWNGTYRDYGQYVGL